MTDWRAYLASDPQICGGSLCARGTRVLVTNILRAAAKSPRWSEDKWKRVGVILGVEFIQPSTPTRNDKSCHTSPRVANPTRSDQGQTCDDRPQRDAQ